MGQLEKKIIIYFQSNSSHFIRWFKSQEYNRAFVTNTTDSIGDLDLNLVKSDMICYGLEFTNIFTISFYACRFPKRKKTDDLTVIFTLLGSAREKLYVEN